MANNNSGKNEKDLVCSFCGKHQDEVERMIIGPGVNTVSYTHLTLPTILLV